VSRYGYVVEIRLTLRRREGAGRNASHIADRADRADRAKAADMIAGLSNPAAALW
jgi:hypothetical protein